MSCIVKSPDLGNFFLASTTKAGNKTQLQIQVVFQHQILAQVNHNIIHPFHWKVLEKADNADSMNKLGLLVNYFTHKMYAFVADTRPYDEARQALNNAYHKLKNIILPDICL